MSPRGLGFATLQVLGAIADGARYGFDLIDRTGLPSGTVYPALASLERRGLVHSNWEEDQEVEGTGRPRRRYYRLTRQGEENLTAAAERMRQVLPPTGDATPA
jgi:DNA-binding PadR family transcriptional regulator